MTIRKNKSALTEMAITIIFLYMTSVAGAYASGGDLSESEQFLVPHIVTGVSAKDEVTTEEESNKGEGRFLRVDESFDMNADIAINATSTGEDIQEKTKDDSSRYDVYSQDSSWGAALKDKVDTLFAWYDEKSKDENKSDNNSYPWLVRLNALRGSFFAMINGSVTGEVQTTPVISSVAATAATETSAHIIWTSSIPGFSRVYYGTSSPVILDVSTASVTTWGMTDHDVELTGLASNTPYYYRIVAFDLRGNATSSGELSFTTKKHK